MDERETRLTDVEVVAAVIEKYHPRLSPIQAIVEANSIVAKLRTLRSLEPPPEKGKRNADDMGTIQSGPSHDASGTARVMAATGDHAVREDANQRVAAGVGSRCSACGANEAEPHRGICVDSPAVEPPREMVENWGEAIIENGMIVIRVPVGNLPAVLEGGHLCNAYDTRWKITDGPVFAKEIVHALNHEDEEGSTPIHKLFDAAINEAIEQGAEGIEKHEDQEP